VEIAPLEEHAERLGAILRTMSNQPAVLGPDGVARPYIGGQALIEGVMMRSPHCFSAVVRRKSGALVVREMPMADLCCGSAGIYNVVQSEMANQILQRKMEFVATTKASLIVTANPGCMLQLSAGARLYGSGQRVAHVVEVLDEAYKAYDAGLSRDTQKALAS